MKRFEDWDQRLAKILADRLDAPFVWGTNDCCLFACDAIRAMTGHDPAEWFRGRYAKKESAYKLLKEFARGEILATTELITQELGMREVQPAFAKRGDVALIEGGLGQTLGVIDLTGMNVAAPGAGGLEFFPIQKIIKAWSV